MAEKDNKQEFRPLPEEYSNSGYTYKLYKRGKKGAIYLCEHNTENGNSSFIAEVFVIKIAKAVDTMVKKKRVVVPEREKIPGNSDFGNWAWCISGRTKEQAISRAKIIFDEIEAGTRPAPQPTKVDDEPVIKT